MQEKQTISLCPACGVGCPEIEIYPERVVIRDGDRWVEFAPETWNLLIEKVRSGELGKIER